MEILSTITVAFYALFLPTFHLLIQPNTTLKHVLSEHQLVATDQSRGAVIKRCCRFTQHTLVHPTPALHHLSDLWGIVTGEIHSTLQSHSAVTFVHPPTSAQQREPWQNGSICCPSAQQCYLLHFVQLES